MMLDWIIFAAPMPGYFTFVIWVLLLQLDLFGQVNSNLPPHQQLPFLGGLRGIPVWRKYKTLFPGATCTVKAPGYSSRHRCAC